MSERNENLAPQVIGRRELAAGRFVSLEDLTWRTAAGQERHWETAERVGGRGAVLLIPWLIPSRRLVLIRQFRPPVNAPVIEFPAGLIDAGETPEDSAVRELREETGYFGRIVSLTPPAYNSPGLTSETVNVVLLEIAEEMAENRHPVSRCESDEHIEVLLVPAAELLDFYQKQSAAGVRFDSKVVAYILAQVQRS